MRCGPNLAIRVSEVKSEEKKDPTGGSFAAASATFQCGPGGAPDLGARVAGAELVVIGKVVSLEAVPQTGGRSEHDPVWVKATVEVQEVLKGSGQPTTVAVLFPSSNDVKWFHSPKFLKDQRGVFVLRKGDSGLTALDPLDFQSFENHNEVWSVLHNG